MSPTLTTTQHAWIQSWIDQAPGLIDLAARFESAGFELALVGGAVRDLVRGVGAEGTGVSNMDIDLTTNANPQQVQRLLEGWADATWDVGVRFGTVGATYSDAKYEITTYRTENYAADSRKPEVAFGTSLVEDLERRDFTVNSMAVKLPSGEFVDPFNGLTDLQARVLRTPVACRNGIWR